MDGNFEHIGEVVDILDNQVIVSVKPESACQSCKAKALCGQDEDGKKLIYVWTQYAEYFSRGEEVVVSVSQAMGMKAVAWAYIFPFFLMLGTLVILLRLDQGEVISGLSSLAVLAVYYLFLFIFRKKIEKEIVFKLRKI